MRKHQIFLIFLAFSLFHVAKLTGASKKNVLASEPHDSSSNDFYAEDNGSKGNNRLESDFYDSSSGNIDFYGEDEPNRDNGDTYGNSNWRYGDDSGSEGYNNWGSGDNHGNGNWGGSHGEGHWDGHHGDGNQGGYHGEGNQDGHHGDNQDGHWGGHHGDWNNENEGNGGGSGSMDDGERPWGSNNHQGGSDNRRPRPPHGSNPKNNYDSHDKDRPSSSSGSGNRHKGPIVSEKAHKLYDDQGKDKGGSSKPEGSQHHDNFPPESKSQNGIGHIPSTSENKHSSSSSSSNSLSPSQSSSPSSCSAICNRCPNCGKDVVIEIPSECIGCHKCLSCPQQPQSSESDDKESSKNCGSYESVAEKCCNMLFLVADEFPPCNNFHLDQCKVTNDDLAEKSSLLYILYLGTNEKWIDEYSKMANEVANNMRRTIESFILRTYSSNDNFQDSIVLEFRNDKDMVEAKVAVRFVNETKGDIVDLYKSIMCGCGCEIIDSTSIKIETANPNALDPYCSAQCSKDVCNDENFVSNGMSAFDTSSGCDPLCCLVPVKSLSSAPLSAIPISSLQPASLMAAAGASRPNAGGPKPMCDPMCASFCSSVCKPECCLPNSMMGMPPFMRVFRRTVKTPSTKS